MKAFGAFLIAVGLLVALWYGLIFDASIPVEPDPYFRGSVSRVHNVGLGSRQIIGVLFGCTMIIVGVQLCVAAPAPQGGIRAAEDALSNEHPEAVRSVTVDSVEEISGPREAVCESTDVKTSTLLWIMGIAVLLISAVVWSQR